MYSSTSLAFVGEKENLEGEERKEESLLLRWDRVSFGVGVAISGAIASSPSPTSSTTGEKEAILFLRLGECHRKDLRAAIL